MRLYNNIKRIWSKNINKELDAIDRLFAYKLISKFITIITYEDTYLMKKLMHNMDGTIRFLIKENKNDLDIDCINFGIVITNKDEISIHT